MEFLGFCSLEKLSSLEKERRVRGRRVLGLFSVFGIFGELWFFILVSWFCFIYRVEGRFCIFSL